MARMPDGWVVTVEADGLEVRLKESRELVMCRSCKHYHPTHEYCELHSEYNLGGDNERFLYMKPEGYCNYGEREEEDG